MLGVANKRSIAWAIAQRLAEGGAQLAFTFQGERIEKNVRELAGTVSSPLVTACDVRSDDDVARVFAEVGETFDGELDLLVHSVAYAAAEDLEGRFTDTPRDRFWLALDVSAYSLVACARAAEPLMEARRRRLDRDDDLPRRRARRAALQRDGRREGGARLVRQVPRLGPRRRRTSASTRSRPGPVRTLAARSIAGFPTMEAIVEERAPLRRHIDADDVGAAAAYLLSRRRAERHRDDALRRLRVPRDGHVAVKARRVVTVPLRRNRDFMLLQAGQLLSSFGTQATSVAYPLLVLAVTGSAAQAGVVAFLRAVPAVLLALPSSLAADRWSRRRLMIAADGVGCCPGGSRCGDPRRPGLVRGDPVVAFVEGCGSAVFASAQAGALRCGRAAAPAAGGGRCAVRPAGGGDARRSTARWSALRRSPARCRFSSTRCRTRSRRFSLLAMRTPFQEERERDRSPLRSQVREGFRFLWGQPFLRTCALLFGLANFLGPGLLLVVVIVGADQGLSGGRSASWWPRSARACWPARSCRRSCAACSRCGPFWCSSCGRGSAVPRSSSGRASTCWRPGILPTALAIPSTDSVVHGYRIAMTPDRLLGRSESVRSTISLLIAPLGPLTAGVLLGAVSARARRSPSSPRSRSCWPCGGRSAPRSARRRVWTRYPSQGRRNTTTAPSRPSS